MYEELTMDISKSVRAGLAFGAERDPCVKTKIKRKVIKNVFCYDALYTSLGQAVRRRTAIPLHACRVSIGL